MRPTGRLIAVPAVLTALALSAAACGGSGSSAAMHEKKTAKSAAMHETTTSSSAMHEGGSTTSRVAGAMSADFVKAADQTSDGTKLVVEDVGLTGHRGFVAVVADNGGAMGDTLGVSPLLQARTTMGVTVPLTKPLTASATVFVVLHVDNGDGSYSAADEPAMQGGSPVALQIRLTVK